MRRHVALEQIELVLPDDCAGVGIERHDALLKGGAAAGRVLHVDAVPHDDGCRPAAVRGAPQEVLAVHGPLLDETGLERHPIPAGSSHFRPVAERDRVRPLSRERHADRERQGGEKETRLEHQRCPQTVPGFLCVRPEHAWRLRDELADRLAAREAEPVF